MSGFSDWLLYQYKSKWLVSIGFHLFFSQLFDSSITAHQSKGSNTIDGGTGIVTSISTSLKICVTRDHWDSDCVHVALRDLEWLVVAPSFKTQCAIPVRKVTTLRVIPGSMHVGPAPDAVIPSLQNYDWNFQEIIWIKSRWYIYL